MTRIRGALGQMLKRRIGAACPYCNRTMTKGQPARPGQRQRLSTHSWQHILPRRRHSVPLWMTEMNLRPCCLGCNELLAKVGDCPGALAAVRAIAPKADHREMLALIRSMFPALWAEIHNHPIGASADA